MPCVKRTVVLLALTLVSELAAAQSQNPGLAGIKGLKLVVETLDENAKSCGINADALDAAMRIPVSNSQLQFVNSPLSPYLYVNLMVLKPETCFVAINTSLYRVVWLDAKGGAATTASVWDTGSVLSGPAYNMGSRVATTLEGHTKQFIGAWLRAN